MWRQVPKTSEKEDSWVWGGELLWEPCPQLGTGA